MPFKFYDYTNLKKYVFKFHRHIGRKKYYFPYKYHIDTGINKLKNKFILFQFFSTHSLFKFIRKKIKILKKLIKNVIYKFYILLYP